MLTFDAYLHLLASPACDAATWCNLVLAVPDLGRWSLDPKVQERSKARFARPRSWLAGRVRRAAWLLPSGKIFGDSVTQYGFVMAASWELGGGYFASRYGGSGESTLYHDGKGTPVYLRCSTDSFLFEGRVTPALLFDGLCRLLVKDTGATLWAAFERGAPRGRAYAWRDGARQAADPPDDLFVLTTAQNGFAHFCEFWGNSGYSEGSALADLLARLPAPGRHDEWR